MSESDVTRFYFHDQAEWNAISNALVLAKKALEDVETCSDSEYGPACPWCGEEGRYARTAADGVIITHLPTCPRALALAAIERVRE